MENIKELGLVEDVLIDELKKIAKKGEIKDASEAKAIKDVLESIEIIHRLTNGNMGEGYSGYYSHPRMHSGHVDFEGSYGTPHMRGYSGHSIYDRMAACLEKLYDQAGSDYERDILTKEIHSLKTK